jgi:hypothetical protein
MDRTLVRAADELADDGRLTGSTWPELAAPLEPAQLLELIILCGWYRRPRFPPSEQRTEQPEQL